MHLPNAIPTQGGNPIIESRSLDGYASTSGLRVLVVEDNPTNLMILRQQLAKLGCSTTTATNGQEALDFLRAKVFDIILMDCLMPVLDGFETTRCWRRMESDEHRTRTPIVAVTALVLQADIDECLASGMDEVLNKPLRMAVLESILLRWCVKAGA